MHKTLKACLGGLLLSLTLSLHATDCTQHYAAGQPPQILNIKIKQKTISLCYRAFAVMHSGLTRTPLWSAEHLTKENVRLASQLVRVNVFKPEINLPNNERAELKDYSRSGYDRGHLSPNGDMPNEEAQYESFSLSNIVPQNPDNNRHLWSNIESMTRKLAIKEGEIFVITGPLFIDAQISFLNNRVAIPTHLFKAIYNPKLGMGGVYLSKNDLNRMAQVISIAELEAMAGINFFPSMSVQVKQTILPMPKPLDRGRKRKKS